MICLWMELKWLGNHLRHVQGHKRSENGASYKKVSDLPEEITDFMVVVICGDTTLQKNRNPIVELWIHWCHKHPKKIGTVYIGAIQLYFYIIGTLWLLARLNPSVFQGESKGKLLRLVN